MENFKKNEVESIFMVLVTEQSEVALQHCLASKTIILSWSLFWLAIFILRGHNS